MNVEAGGEGAGTGVIDFLCRFLRSVDIYIYIVRDAASEAVFFLLELWLHIKKSS